jgi:uncharacterized protein (DUF927 family)
MVGDFGNSRALADHLSVASSRVFGVVGNAWLEYLTRERAEQGQDVFCSKLKERLQQIEARLFRLNADGQVGRATRRFALLALAGSMASEAGIVVWTTDQSITMVERCLDSWIAERGGTGASEEMQALRQVQHFFEQNGQAAFQRVGHEGLEGTDDSRTIANRAGFFSTSENGGMYYVLPEPFKTRVCEGLSWKQVTEVLVRYGLMSTPSSRTVRLAGLPNPPRVYCIDARIVGFDPDFHVMSVDGPAEIVPIAA